MSEPIVHKRTSAAPKQMEFPHRRHNTRSGASRAIPQKLKRQSTLTQLDFVSTPHSSREIIPDSGDEDEDREEYLEQRPKKRRKADRKPRDQSTLTQNWRRVVRNPDQGSSGDELQTDWEEDAAMIGLPQQSRAQDTQGTARYLYGRVQEVSSEMHDVPADGQSGASSAFQQHRMLVASSDAGGGSTRPTTADSKANPKTPKTVRRTEVPSSQTPSSAILSVHQSRRTRDYAASPLKGRSCTPTPLKKLPRSQTSSPSKRMLEHMESDIHKMKSSPSNDIQCKVWKAEIASSPRQKQISAPAKRRLIRTTTVQDSQDDLALGESPEDNIIDPAAITLKPAELKSESEGRSLKRAHTILDSEAGSDLDEIDVGMDDDENDLKLPVALALSQNEQEKLCVDHPDLDSSRTLQDHNDINNYVYFAREGEGTSYEYKYSASLQQQTFDPVSAALDRDAARFGRNPTQLVTQHHSYAGFREIDAEEEIEVYEHREDVDEDEEGMLAENMHDDVERVNDSEPEFVAESPMGDADPETQFVAQSPPTDEQHVSSPELACLRQAPANATEAECEQAVGASPTNKGYPQSMAAVPDTEDLELPMPISPKYTRPSQVSTVVSTQHTAHRPNSGHGNTPTSPQKSAAWANALSSSPFPLPPESWRGAQSYRDLETQSSGIFDFSLPPPPPLLSPSRQTPASSSR